MFPRMRKHVGEGSRSIALPGSFAGKCRKRTDPPVRFVFNADGIKDKTREGDFLQTAQFE